MLPIPQDLISLEGVPTAYATLQELADSAELLVLVATTETAMADRLRQTLVGLHESVHTAANGAASVAAVSLVVPNTYRKLSRKAGVDYPMLSDPGRVWLGPLAADSGVSVLLVSVSTAMVLARWSEQQGTAQEVVRSVEATISNGRAAIELEVRTQLQAAAAAAAVAESVEAESRMKREAEAEAKKQAAEAKANAKLESQRKAAEELEALNRRVAEQLAAEADTKNAKKRAKEEKRLAAKAEAKQAKAVAVGGGKAANKKDKVKQAQAEQKAQKKEQEQSQLKKQTVAAAVATASEATVTATATATTTAKAKGTPSSATNDVPGATYDPSKMRNFCIIAHIDHGKSTLADRLLQLTNSVEAREMKDQLLDNMEIERERGITIKLQAARMEYTAEDGETYVLNLIDTPGHVDFQYEVSRSLAACEGALLIVDASQGVEAQTIANAYLASSSDLTIVPVLNKIDLPGADTVSCAEEIESTLGLDCTDAIPCSAKVGTGVPEILEAIVKRMPPPVDRAAEPLRALIFDSYYDAYRGVVLFVRIVDGALRRGDKVRFAATGVEHEVLEVGTLSPQGERACDELRAGEVGYVLGGIKSVADARVGDTITLAKAAKGSTLPRPLPGYREPVPVVYCGLFPVETTQYQLLRDSLERLCLNDAALKFEPETSSAMGFGFRCGFLGLLHMEIVQERLEREYDLDLIVTAPSVVYKVELNDGTELEVDSPSKLVDADQRAAVYEPYVDLEMFCPKEISGTLMELAQERRGEYVDLKFLTAQRCSVKYAMPLAEVITDFFDQMKSRSKGYASMEYALSGYRKNELVRLDILINGEQAKPLAAIVHRDDAQRVGKALTRRLKELIPRQQFKVPIQAAIGQKIVASSQISPIRKDVLAKCYGGDISRKKKLLQKQAKGKKRMKMMGQVNVPQEAFMAVLNLKDGA